MPDETTVGDKGAGLRALKIRGGPAEFVGLTSGRVQVPRKLVSFLIDGVQAPPIDPNHPIVFLLEAGVDSVKGHCSSEGVTLQPSRPMTFDASNSFHYFAGYQAVVHQVTVWHGDPQQPLKVFSYQGRAAELKLSW